MTKRNTFESYMKNISAMENVIKKKQEEIEQLEGQVRSAKDNLVGSVSAYMVEQLGLMGKEGDIEAAYTDAKKAVIEKVTAENKMEAADNILGVMLLTGDIMKKEWYGASTDLSVSCFILMNKDLSKKVDVISLSETETYKKLRAEMMERLSLTEEYLESRGNI